MDSNHIVPIHLKLALNVREAAAHSNIGINRIQAMLRAPNCPFALHVGDGKRLVKRLVFEEFIRRELSVYGVCHPAPSAEGMGTSIKTL